MKETEKTITTKKRVYLFHEGSADMRDLLGGKGANLAEMANIGLPVPPGFTITTEVCREYYANNRRLPDGLMDEVRQCISEIEKQIGKKFGDPSSPLLVSVRSGAKFSMPGMMDTILNLGLNEKTLEGFIRATNNPRSGWDAYRRLLVMFGDVVLGIPKQHTESILAEYKAKKQIKLDTELTVEDLQYICNEYLKLIKNETGQEFPQDPWKQLEMAIEAVFRSWNNERAIVYRRQEKIPDDLGTACTVQAMVFGNMGEDSGTGVAFTRDPSTGEKIIYGDYLSNAQGEDVVAGIRTPMPISELEKKHPELYRQFEEIADKLERHYRDMMDIEFTVERGKLYILQCRVGKRTGTAAVKVAVDMVKESLISKEDAIARISASHLDQLLHPRIDQSYLAENGIKPIAKGIPASPGAATGKAVFDADRAAELGHEGQKVILVRSETNPDDVHGMLASQAIVTSRGGKTSHAAVVARGFGIPCIVGCEGIDVDEVSRTFTANGIVVREGAWITVDGTMGELYNEKLPLIEPEVSGDFAEFMSWCDEFRRLGVRANADNPRDARTALRFGAEGIGLCRTEHMFFGRDRLPIMQQMILAETEEERELALDKLLTMQQRDFEGIFEVMDGKPVTIRLLDPPLHEFLPSYDELLKQVVELRLALNTLGGEAIKQVLEDKQKLLNIVETMREANPMLGLRGVRLSILYPSIVAMQTRAILNAAIKVKKRGIHAEPEIMIPLVGHVNELKFVREKLEQVATEVVQEAEQSIPYKFGTMIEIPRACLTADEIAQYAEFFSFGTNDLTQTTFGFSRDDAEGKFLGKYIELKILNDNPFETLDKAGVGALMKLCVEDAKKTNPVIKLGICGEHGGDPASIAFCHELGLDYVSCSPFRVPIARLAAAQAAIKASERVIEDK
ncbi:MAG TPA: pyruvate, phosphate dikinase [Fimbriimonadales bacterium]|nr:pyruvate, phosphate dikinase [Fimbriimonadales bacterium]